MGLAGGFVKKVLSKTRSSASAAGRCRDERGNACFDKGLWSLSKLKLCGEDSQSVLDEHNDLASVSSLEVTITAQSEGGNEEATATISPIESSESEGIHQGKTAKGNSSWQDPKEEGNSKDERSEKEDAAVMIQSAFRGYMTRSQSTKLIQIEKEEFSGKISMGTSTEVQAGDSLRSHPQFISVQQKVHHRGSKPQISHLKEWDDSTLSSKSSNMRIQNRIEAMTRRERALAYAFSQQLRTCSAKRRTTKSESHDSNLGWSWLERWMATRFPENKDAMEEIPCKNNKLIYGDTLFKKQFDLALEEKESCASNDVSVSFENYEKATSEGRNKNPLKAQKKSSRRNDLTDYYHHSKWPTKVVRVQSLREAEQEKRKKQMQKPRSSEKMFTNPLDEY